METQELINKIANFKDELNTIIDQNYYDDVDIYNLEDNSRLIAHIFLNESRNFLMKAIEELTDHE